MSIYINLLYYFYDILYHSCKERNCIYSIKPLQVSKLNLTKTTLKDRFSQNLIFRCYSFTNLFCMLTIQLHFLIY